MQNGSSHIAREQTLPLDKNFKADQKQSPLFSAVFAGDEKTVENLLAAGADRNIKDTKHGNTPLHEAAWRGYSRCVKALCTLPKVGPNGRDAAKKSKQIKCVIESTQNVLHSTLLSVRNAGGFSALHLAAQNGHNQSCREILLAGVDPDVQNNYGDTPLHTACRYGHAGATRILLSAKCDPLRVNLNGDTALHIACAMGRRKLTRILVEASGISSLIIKNAQSETASDIAHRKNLIEIIDILNVTAIAEQQIPFAIDTVDVKRSRDYGKKDGRHNNQKRENGIGGGDDKSKSKRKSKDLANVPDAQQPKNWSPYGCHYFPDPRTFPSPKLETLPKEPLGTGEQYYLDLAGNIRKGPVGVGNTCYCGPFFRHIEQRISQNKKSFKKYVQKATGRLDSKVQALALQTEDKIEQIARSMLSERSCDNHRSHLEQWLKRGDQLRATVANHVTQKSSYMTPKAGSTLTRSRSLEILDDSQFAKRHDLNTNAALGRSCDLLDGSNHEVLVHRGMNDDMETGRSHSAHRSAILSGSDCRRYSSSHERDKHSTSGGQYESEEFVRRRHDKSKQSVAERLEELLSKTNEIIQMERIVRRKYKEKSLNTDYRDHMSKHSTSDKYKVSPSSRREQHDSGLSMYDDGLMKICQGIDHHLSNDEIADKMKNITVQLGSSLSSCRSKSATSSSHQSQTFELTSRHGKKVNEKHKDNRMTIEAYAASNCGDEHDYETQTDPRNQKLNDTSANNGESHGMDNFNCGFFQNTCFDDVSSVSSNTLKSTKMGETVSNSVSGTDEFDGRCDLPAMADMKELYELKSRILNGTHWRSQVLRKSTQDVVQRASNDLMASPTLSMMPVTAMVDVHNEPVSSASNVETANSQTHSEDSSDEDSEINRPPTIGPKPIPSLLSTGICFSSQIIDTPSTSRALAPIPSSVYHTRYLIPKDAYFHELPVKKDTTTNRVDSAPSQENGFSLPPRNRKPLPYTNSDDEILTNSQPPPLIMTNYLKNMNLNNNSQQHVTVPDFRQTKTDYASFAAMKSISTPTAASASASTSAPAPAHERLLSNRKFSAVTSVTPLPSVILCEPEAMPFANRNGNRENRGHIEHENNNQSKFNGNIGNGSILCNGNHSNLPTTHSNSSEFVFSNNIGASSLV